MFKITKTKEHDNTINLRMDGKLVEEWLSEFETLYLKIRSEDYKRIIIDLSGVSFIDDNGIDFIQKIKDVRIDIINCSPFIESLLGDLVNRDRIEKQKLKR
jgi:anti-anti-sigma regulatory factor